MKQGDRSRNFCDSVPIATFWYLYFIIGLLFFVIGIGNVINSAYTGPNTPPGYVIGVAFMLAGSADIVTCATFLGKRWTRTSEWMKFLGVLVAFLGLIVVGMGIYLASVHPLELSPCMCEPNYFGAECQPCPPCVSASSDGCNDGVDGTGECLCKLGFAGETCDRCADTFTGDSCDQCKRGWTDENCDRCDIGYGGANCDSCLSDWVTESDASGTLCRKCKPNRYGRNCKQCPNCAQYGDTLATCKDNDWYEQNVYNADKCTSTGQTCSSQDDCASFNCKGECGDGRVTSGYVCESDDECLFGTCQFKTCCSENRYSEGICACNRVGYYGPFCQKAPGFDGIYSSSICSSHGTPSEVFVQDDFSHLQCVCNAEGTSEWSGHTCGCLKNSANDDQCTKCSDGHYGSQCNVCPGGVGISQCSRHGSCDDGLSGNGTCTCDIDIKYGGLGGWKTGIGGSCTSCYSGDFYGSECKTCPGIMMVACANGDFLATLPGSGNCIASCLGAVGSCNTSSGICNANS